jgi:hypothetical protein
LVKALKQNIEFIPKELNADDEWVRALLDHLELLEINGKRM